MTANNTTELKSFLKDHPKLLGMLFGATVLFGQAGPVLAGNGSYNGGP